MNSETIDVCEKAADVTRNKCGLEFDSDDDVECTGDEEAKSQCAVDNEDAYCEYLDKLQAGEFTFTNDYTECVSG